MTLSLKWKMTINMWLLAALCTITASILSGWILIKSYEDSIDQQLQSTAATLMSLGISDYSGLEKFQKLDLFVEEALQFEKINQIIRVFTRKGKMMFSSPPVVEEDFSPSLSLSEKPELSLFKGAKKKYRILTTPYKGKTGKQYFLQVAIPYPPYQEILKTTAWVSILLFLALLLIAFAIANLLARKIIAPVRSLAIYLNNLNPSDIKEWQPFVLAKAGEYLNDITVGINALSRRIKSALYGMSRMSRYLAHELKNPLTILRGEAETLLLNPSTEAKDYRKVLESSLEEIDRMDNVITTVTKLFKKEKHIYRPTPCNLTLWLDEEIIRWNKLLDRPILWEKPLHPIIVVLEPDLLLQLIDNFIRNIKKHTPLEAQCHIELVEAEDGTLIKIQDTGPGMPDEMIEAINNGNLSYERISIGLSLCLEIASVCNFKLFFSNKASGGLMIQILLG